MTYYYGKVVYKVAWAQQQIADHILKESGISQADRDEFLDAIRRKESLSMEIHMKDCKNISTREDPNFVVTKRFIRMFNREFLNYLRDYLDARHIAINKKAWKQTIKLLNQYSKDKFNDFAAGRLTKANIIKLRRER